MAPLLMAPGTDFGAFSANMGMDSAYACRSTDNDQSAPVECDIAQGLSSTSYAAAAASGTALLVRDYFQQGFYPDGTSSDPGNAADQVPSISGALRQGGARHLRRLDGRRRCPSAATPAGPTASTASRATAASSSQAPFL